MIRVEEHPIHEQIKSKRLKLWEVKSLLGGAPSESHLSRMLRGICPMPEDLEARIRTAIENL